MQAIRLTRKTLQVLVLLTFSINVQGQTLTNKLDKYLQGREQGLFTGVVLVDKDGEIILKKGYGKADFELNVPNTPDRIFRIASLTKTFTATAILHLYERGRLQLSDNLIQYLPQYPPDWREVQIHHLLNHTSGIPDAFTELNDAPLHETGTELERVLAEISSNPAQWALKSTAGETYAYSNFNYVLLGYIMEKVSHQYWEDYLSKNIFEPLGMLNTRYDDVWTVVPGRVHGYTVQDSKIRKQTYDDHSAYAAGGLLSTVGDLGTFLKAYFSGRILSRATLEKALQPYQGNYGYGWQVIDFFGRTVYNHTGSIAGFSTHMAYYPDEAVSIIVLSNNQTERALGTACDLAALIFEEDHVFLDTKTIELPDEMLSQYVGEFIANGDDGEIRLTQRDGRLLYSRGTIENDYLPVAPDMFVQKGRPEYSLRFHASTGGEPLEFSINICGRNLLSARRKK